MEKGTNRRSILKPLVLTYEVINKNLIFNLTYWELLICFLLLLTIVCLDAFSNYVVLFKIIFSCIWLSYILSIIIKIHHQNIYQYLIKILIFNYEKNQHLKKAKSLNILINNENVITYLNKKYFVKQLIATKLYSNLDEQWEQLSTNANISNNLIILAISTNDLMQDYLTKLDGVQVNEGLTNYWTNHKTDVDFINDTSSKKQFFVLFQQETDLTCLNSLSWIKLNDPTSIQLKLIQTKFDLWQKSNKYESKYFVHDNLYYYLMKLNNLKINQTLGWLWALLNLNLDCECLVFINKLKKETAIERLNKLNPSPIITNKKQKEIGKDQSNLIHLYKNEIAFDHDDLVGFSFYYLLHATDSKQLTKLASELKAWCLNINIQLELVKWNYLSILDWMNNQDSLLITSIHLKIGLMTITLNYHDSSGIYLGNDKNNLPFVFNQFSYLNELGIASNGISLILGKSGAGKSILLKKIIYLSLILMHQQIIIFDVEDEYKLLIRYFPNCLLINSIPLSIDPFQIKFTNQDEKLLFLQTFFLQFNSKLDLINALIDYFNLNTQPTFWKFLTYLKQTSPLNYAYLKFLDTAIYQNWFNTQIDLTNYQLIIINFKPIFDKELITSNNLINVTLILIFTYISMYVFSNHSKLIHLVIDEAHKFINLKNEAINNIWYSFIKKTRKYQTCLTFCTQNFNDLFNHNFANKILGNIQYLFIGQVNDIDLNDLVNYFNLNQSEQEEFKRTVLSLNNKEFLFCNSKQSFNIFTNYIDPKILKQYYLTKNNNEEVTSNQKENEKSKTA